MGKAKNVKITSQLAVKTAKKCTRDYQKYPAERPERA
jgi:hypothetical protein